MQHFPALMRPITKGEYQHYFAEVNRRSEQTCQQAIDHAASLPAQKSTLKSAYPPTSSNTL
ncbi:hypothetical protein [Echinimonas agarilytica]|uniref:Uncharacterized protein n=1 Tax=Echinimonas agarilytica TaxID=1215918 RepID=A0AA41W5D4_9GAMM|nr:hypothetical protein [Echinimonas agarilytica]MCM2679041.1 hypothetical protein [Echinimonas agarilytica]